MNSDRIKNWSVAGVRLRRTHSYECYSLSMLRRIAGVLGANVYVGIEPKGSKRPPIVAETKAAYRVKRKTLSK